MRLRKFVPIFLLVFAFTKLQIQAQVIDDWESRPSLSLEYNLNKDWSLTGTYYIYLDHTFSQYDKSELGAELGYKVNSWLKMGIDYRYGIKNGGHSHDIRYSATFDYHPSKKWKLAYRAMVQQEFVSLKKAHFKTNPVEYNMRNRITASYDLTKAMELYIFTENYLQLHDGDLNFHRQKTGLGMEFDITERSEIETRLELRNNESGKNKIRINLGYTLNFGYGKRKK